MQNRESIQNFRNIFPVPAGPAGAIAFDMRTVDKSGQRFGVNGSVPSTSRSPEMPECARA